MDLMDHYHIIEQALWKSFDEMRGLVDQEDARNYVLGLLALKKLSNIDRDKVIDWSYITSQDYDIGKVLNKVFQNIEKKYPSLQGKFGELNFDSERIGGPEKVRGRQIRDKLWKGVISSISVIDLSFIGKDDLQALSNLCIYINDILRTKSSRYGESETPSTTIHLMTALLAAEKGATIYDPFCHSGETLIKAAALASIAGLHEKPKLFGQTSSSRSALTANLNMLLAGHQDARIAIGDVIRQPSFIVGTRVMTFDKIFCTIPTGHWSDEIARHDPYSRFAFGIPPATMGDFGYLQHCIASLAEEGVLVVAVLPGILFRGRTEGEIRRRMIEKDIIEAVIQLPPKLYSQTNLSFTLLVIRRNKSSERKNKLLFINAKNDFLPIRSQNVLRDLDIEKIVNAYREFKDIEGYCSVYSIDQIAEKQFHLDVPIYIVEKSTQTMQIDINSSMKELDEIQKRKIELYELMRSNLEKMLRREN